MRRYRKNRWYSDCDSLHSDSLRSNSFDTPMSFGNVPIDMVEDYGKNGARHILNANKIKFYTNWPYNAEVSEAFRITRLLKI